MKLISHIIVRLSIVFSVVLACWAVFFYFTILDEINDEVDDSLEDYSEQLMMRFLAGEEMPSKNSNSNNQYYLNHVTHEYARSKPHISYYDSMVYIPVKRETEPARILTTIYRDDNDEYYELVVFTPTIEKKDLKEAILYWVIFLYAGLLLVIILVSIWIYQRSNRPLHKLLVWMDEYKIGKTNTPLQNDTDITEYKKLNEGVTRNMERAQEVFEEQKQFIGNASHEMQTPLAVCRNRIESLMEDETLSEHQLEELAKTLHTLDYITKLNKTLLLLSKIENKQFSDAGDININTLVDKFIQDYREVYAYMHIREEVHENDTLTIRINETLASILVNNLIKNSYVHNIADGKVVIEISSNKLIVKNSGQDYPLNPKTIYERFYQGNKKEGSTGLGLSLVKSICESASLQLNYTFQDNLHGFEISVPKK